MMRRTIPFLAVIALALAACQGSSEDGGRTPAPSTSGAPPSQTGPPSTEAVTLQLGNERPTTALALKTPAELTGNGIGDLFPLDRHPAWGCPPPKKDWSWTHVESLGLTWVRISLDRMDWEQAVDQDDYSRFHINRCQDEMVSLFARRGITMVHTIVYWDPELNAERPPDLGNEQEIQLFLDYVRLLVRHFQDRIRYWEILNEAVWYVGLPDYLDLIRRVVPIIREEQPNAKIIAGGASDLSQPINRDYLFGLLRSDVVQLLDGIVWHPMYGASPEYEDTREYYEEYPALVREIRDVAEAHGFAGEYFAEEMGWRTSIEPSPYEPWGYTPNEKAKYTARAIVMHRGMDIWAGIGLNPAIRPRPFLRAVRNLTTGQDGAEPAPLDVQIQTEASDVMSYGFSLPDGDRLFALWTNGIAADNDPGVPATLTFSGFRATGAVGIDVLDGFQQELVAQHADRGLVIEGLLVKDYPIFVRLAG